MMWICPLFVAHASNLSIIRGDFVVFLVSRSVSVNICHVATYTLVMPTASSCIFEICALSSNLTYVLLELVNHSMVILWFYAIAIQPILF